MASLKAIRKRISSVKNTQQITKAMKMVAAAKLRRAQEAALAARPYADKLEGMVGHLAANVGAEVHPLLRQPGTDGRTLLIVVSSDKGLCGGYNANLSRRAEQFLAHREGEFQIEMVGRKAAEQLRHRRGGSTDHLAIPLADAAPDLARDLARRVQAAFVADEIDSVHVLYSAFVSAMTQTPTVERLLPLDTGGGESQVAEPSPADEAVDYLFEPGPNEIIGYLLPRLLEVRILHAILEAGASEQAARMSAMDSATRNASEMLDRLTLAMNRARQAQITTELMEIISGAEALNG